MRRSRRIIAVVAIRLVVIRLLLRLLNEKKMMVMPIIRIATIIITVMVNIICGSANGNADGLVAHLGRLNLMQLLVKVVVIFLQVQLLLLLLLLEGGRGGGGVGGILDNRVGR